MYKKLSEAERLIMEELWRLNRPVSVKELESIYSLKEKDWKVQTISTFLTRMEQKGFVSFQKKGKTKFYFPLVTPEGADALEAQELLEHYYEGSFKKFLLALSNKRISEKEAEALEKWLDEQKEG